MSSRCCAVRLLKNELPLQRGACIYARLLKTNVCDAPGPSGRARRGSKPMPCRVQTHVHLISLRQGARRGLPGGRHRALACAAWPFLNKMVLSPRRRAHFAFKRLLNTHTHTHTHTLTVWDPLGVQLYRSSIGGSSWGSQGKSSGGAALHSPSAPPHSPGAPP